MSMLMVLGNVWGAQSLPIIPKQKNFASKLATLKAALTKKNKKNKVAPAASPIGAPGLLASQQRFVKGPEVRKQVYRRLPRPAYSGHSSGKSSVLLTPVSLNLGRVSSPSSPGALSPLSATLSPVPLVSSSSESDTLASGRSDQSGLSSLSPASPASPVPLASSPDSVNTQSAVLDVATMLTLTVSPAITPAPDAPLPQEFMLPGAAQSGEHGTLVLRVLSEDVGEKEADVLKNTRTVSQDVTVGSLGELPDNPDGKQYEDELGRLDFDKLAYVDQVRIIPFKAVTMKDIAALRQSAVREVAAPGDAWTPLMEAAWNGDLEAIKEMNFTYVDLREMHGEKQNS